ncbi:ribonuclease J [cf. Phormidesmis sp. LEGE 11477]|uniref:ribonuclease J n=1 Tax=cf. Phormidesmis sp. LEGE 11477 TaxID=1828680 RepID=UPI001882533E|nr:ribonuclease J [cf. Phormidesmis sp. LEGE 11477]MBE9060050.1 ribonuclease J [cf. Phormidesmis sp. LEGE 11477]
MSRRTTSSQRSNPRTSNGSKDSSKRQDSKTLKIIPLGGLHEIGKNTCVFEYGDEIVLLDAGLSFPTEGMHGVNIVLPDITYLKENQHKIKGMIVTHGHEDHIGGIAFHLKQFNIPVIHGPRLAMALLQGKLEEAGVLNRTELHTVGPRDTVQFGKHFSAQYIRNTHSMADSFTMAIKTPVGTIIHSGDFKVDHTPVDGEFFDFQKIAEYGEEGVLCLISDSTNAEIPGNTPSERAVFPNLDREFNDAEGRLFVTTFASSVHRVSMLLELAQKHKRSVFVVGRSMLNVISHARNLGYIKCPDSLFKPLNQLKQCPNDQAMILTTGSQGEPMAALTRIANRSHRQIRIEKGDTVIFSSNPIPGNTISVVGTIDKLMQQGARVIYGKGKGLHVSGHGYQEDHKLMLALTRPKFFIPVHGEHRMLVKHAEMAQQLGVEPQNIAIVNNGDVVKITPENIAVDGKVTAGIELVDASRTGIVERSVLKERQQLAEDGIITVSAAVDSTGRLLGEPTINLRGVVTTRSQAQWESSVIPVVTKSVQTRWKEVLDDPNSERPQINWDGLRSRIEEDTRRFIRRELPKQYPVTVLMLQHFDASAKPAVLSTDSTNDNKPTQTGRRRRSLSTASAS